MSTLNCTTCLVSNAKACSSCQAAAYCSKECQSGDWPLHRLLCKKYNDFKATRPPSSGPDSSGFHHNYKIGIWFPVSEKTPKLIWVEYKQKSPPSYFAPPNEQGHEEFKSQIEEVPIYEHLFEPGTITTVQVSSIATRDTEDSHSLQLFCPEKAANEIDDEWPPNQSIGATTSFSSQALHRGPVLLISQSRQILEREHDNSTRFEDTTLAHFRTAVEYFSAQIQNDMRRKLVSLNLVSE